MRIIDRYVCREVLSHALVGLAVFSFVLFVPQLVSLMNLVVRHAGGPEQIAELFLATFPGVLTFTVPMAVLVGVLIGLGRMSADSELIAMNAAGMGLRRLLVPIGAFALLGGMLTLSMTVWLTPYSLRALRVLKQRMSATQASYAVEPRIFNDQFPHLMLYVQDASAAATRWQGVLLAEFDAGDISRLTVAEDAIVATDRDQGKLQLHLRNGSTHEFSAADPKNYNISKFTLRDLTVSVAPASSGPAEETPTTERPVSQLLAQTGPEALDAGVELHKRLAFPAACLVFALVALPIGSRPRRGGRSAGFLIALALVCGYYFIFTVGASLAKSGSVPVWLGIWAANILTAIGGLILLPTVTRMPGDDRLSRLVETVFDWSRWRSGRQAGAAYASAAASGGDASRAGDAPNGGGIAVLQGESNGGPNGESGGGSRFDNGHGETSGIPSAPGGTLVAARRGLRTERAPSSPKPHRRFGINFPQLLDYYVLRNFLFYFVLSLAGFLLLFEAFTFFDLFDDIAKHRVPIMDVVNYFRYLACSTFYQLAPLACLVSILITLGVLTKNNELVAFKAAGVSLYRIALPLILVGLLLAGGLVVLDDTYLPYANQRQDALRNMIKGRPAQTYFQPGQQWIFGDHSKVYNYKFFDPDHNVFAGLNVFELDPRTFAIERRIYAERAHWEPKQNAWILESGWVRDFALAGDHWDVTRDESFPVTEFSELDETPGYFNREVRQSQEMTWWELRQYIGELSQAGFDVARLSVQLDKKLAFPLIAPVIILMAIPFSILVGTRGAVGGIALGVGLGIVYWAASALFEAFGAIGQLPPAIAAWSPDVIFLFIGLYFFLRMPT